MVVEIFKNYDPRIRIFYLIFAILFVTLAGGVTYRQVLLGPKYRELEKRQNLRRILIPGPRGNIFDREGRLIVGNRPLFSAVVYLNELRPEFRREYIELVKKARSEGRDITREALQIEARARAIQVYLNRINRILGRQINVNERALERHFRQNLLLPLPLIKDLEMGEYAKLIEQIPVESPVQILADSARFYPYGSAASHALGYVTLTYDVPTEGVPGKALTTFRFKGKTGRNGIENRFDEHLQGTSGGEIWIVDPSGFKYERIARKSPIKGRDIRTSLDIDLQLAAEKGLGDRVGAVVALAVYTGEVLTLADKPDYDLNQLSPYIPYEVDEAIRERGAWLPRATQGLYPPGSTFKLLTTMAGLRNKKISLASEAHCPGYYFVGRRRFHCHRRSGHGLMGLTDAIAQSCNVFFYQHGIATGVDALSSEARRFGFHRPTGIELLSESRLTLVPDPKWKRSKLLGAWTGGDTANMAIGQGFLRLTPLQMACFTSSLARRQTRTKPTLIHDPMRRFASVEHGGFAIGLSESEYAALIEGMETAVQTGTARCAQIGSLRIAGKTGTAQFRANNQNTSLAWFLAFAPVDDPKIAVAVVVQGMDAEDHYEGGLTAAPIGRAVMEAFFLKDPEYSGLLAALK